MIPTSPISSKSTINENFLNKKNCYPYFWHIIIFKILVEFKLLEIEIV